MFCRATQAASILPMLQNRVQDRGPSLRLAHLRRLPSGAAAILALDDRACRWPIGEVADEGFRFCGATRQRGPYCTHHRALARAGATR